MLAWARRELSVRVSKGSEECGALLVSPNYFETLQIKPVAGSLFSSQHETAGSQNGVRVVLARSYWRTRFHSDLRAIGTGLYLNGLSATIIGVAPGSAGTPDVGYEPSLFVSLEDEPIVSYGHSLLSKRDSLWLSVMARKRAGVSDARLRGLLTEVWKRVFPLAGPLYVTPAEKAALLANGVAIENGEYGWTTVRLNLATTARVLLFFIAGLLCVTFANVSGALIAKHVGRASRDSIRLALGASRGSLIVTIVVDCVFLAFISGLIALIAEAFLGPSLLSYLTQLGSHQHYVFSLDWSSFLLLTGLIAALTILTSFLANWWSHHIDAGSALKGNAYTVRGSLGFKRLSGSLVLIQTTCTAAVVPIALICANTMYVLQHQKLGFSPAGVYTFLVNVRQVPQKKNALASFYSDLLQRIHTQDPTAHLGLIAIPPVRGWSLSEDVTATSSNGEIRTKTVLFNRVSGSAFVAYGTRLLHGRTFDERDTANSPLVCVISKTAEEQLFHGPGTQGFIQVQGLGGQLSSYRVIGVVEDSKYLSVRQQTPPVVYFPFTQETDRLASLFMVVNVPRDPEQRLANIHRVIAESAPAASLGPPVPLSVEVAQSVAKEKLLYRSTFAFGVIALLLTVLSLYSLVTYIAQYRRSEIGIRLALGASRASIFRLIFRSALLVSLLGLAVGLPFAKLGASGLSSEAFLLTNSALGWRWLYAFTILLILFISTLACLGPAIRSTLLDPQKVLRQDLSS